MAPSSAARRDVVQLHPPARRVAAKAKRAAVVGWRVSREGAVLAVFFLVGLLAMTAFIRATHSREALAATACCAAPE